MNLWEALSVVTSQKVIVMNTISEGCGFEPHKCQRVASLGKTLYSIPITSLNQGVHVELKTACHLVPVLLVANSTDIYQQNIVEALHCLKRD